VRDILSKLRDGRQTLMFSATLPRSLADFASAGLSAPQLVQLDAERRLSPDLQLGFFSGEGQPDSCCGLWRCNITWQQLLLSEWGCSMGLLVLPCMHALARA
jgi:hypothetical protein